MIFSNEHYLITFIVLLKIIFHAKVSRENKDHNTNKFVLQGIVIICSTLGRATVLGRTVIFGDFLQCDIKSPRTLENITYQKSNTIIISLLSGDVVILNDVVMFSDVVRFGDVWIVLGDNYVILHFKLISLLRYNIYHLPISWPYFI